MSHKKVLGITGNTVKLIVIEHEMQTLWKELIDEYYPEFDYDLDIKLDTYQ